MARWIGKGDWAGESDEEGSKRQSRRTPGAQEAMPPRPEPPDGVISLIALVRQAEERTGTPEIRTDAGIRARRRRLRAQDGLLSAVADQPEGRR